MQRGDQEMLDCLVVGGGPAGLSAALYLARLRRSVAVVDDRSGRSLWSQVNRNYLGFPDGIDAVDLRELGREQAARYGVRFAAGSVCAVEHTEGGFAARLVGLREPGTGTDENARADLEHGQTVGERSVTGEREMRARTLILATGVSDRFPTFPGSDECVGRTLFWCLICDGYEAHGKRVVLLGEVPDAAEAALQLCEMGAHVTLVAASPGVVEDEETHEALRASGIRLYEASPLDFRADSGCVRSVRLDDAASTTLALDLLFVMRGAHPRSELAAALGAHTDEKGYVIADREQKTNVPGVFVAGDVTRAHNHQVSSAVHEGGMAAAAANYVLFEQWRQRLGA